MRQEWDDVGSMVPTSDGPKELEFSGGSCSEEDKRDEVGQRRIVSDLTEHLGFTVHCMWCGIGTALHRADRCFRIVHTALIYRSQTQVP
jgi:hypothetical protein